MSIEGPDRRRLFRVAVAKTKNDDLPASRSPEGRTTERRGRFEGEFISITNSVLLSSFKNIPDVKPLSFLTHRIQLRREIEIKQALSFCVYFELVTSFEIRRGVIWDYFTK